MRLDICCLALLYPMDWVWNVDECEGARKQKMNCGQLGGKSLGGNAGDEGK